MGIKINSEDTKAYVVVGAPHSATSYIAKLLSEDGVNMGSMGKVSGRIYYYEDERFKRMNKRILNEAGGSLREPVSREKVSGVTVEDEIKKLVDRDRGRFWGWKDPRTTMTLHKYLPHMEDDVYLICCFRRPKRVLDSYKNKSGFGKEFTKEILDSYNRSLLETVEEFCEL